ncbi:hypothetical protein P0L94_08470 [Microbacter sp. GSS18]|nr:hypothetical protein P0L94_08470 [Microbacter sp. GSS18]
MHETAHTPAGLGSGGSVSAPPIRRGWMRLSAAAREILSTHPHALLDDGVLRRELAWIADAEIPRDARLCAEDIAFIEAIDLAGGPHRDAYADVALEPLGPSAWRACDRRVARDDAASLLGYVEYAGRRYQVMWVRGRVRAARYDCLDDVLSDAAIVRLAGGTRGSQRPHRIPSRPPRSTPRDM